jgi:glycosyltransferase involved in cell wall biosynthesis
LLLWFTQQGSGSLLNAAARVVDAILTVDERTVPLRSPKVHAIGHGIDVDALRCVPERVAPLRRLLGLGRYTPVKGWETVLRALAELPQATLVLHGPMSTDADRLYRPQLERLAGELGVGDRVAFGDEVAYAEVPHLFELADAVVNATHGNAADKVVYEAAASCLPVFAASPVFDGWLPETLRFHGDFPGSLADRIRSYEGGAGPELRARVVAQHSVDHWAAARRHAATEVGRGRRRRRPSRRRRRGAGRAAARRALSPLAARAAPSSGRAAVLSRASGARRVGPA